MKVAGIVLIVWGGLAVLAAILQVMRGFEANFAGLSLIVLGTFLISRAKKKQEEKKERNKWFINCICNRLLLNILQVISQKYGLNL